MKNWDLNKQEHVETPKPVKLFLDEIKDLCKKWGYSISHEDYQGSFIIGDYDEDNIEWLNNAQLNI